jgi:hypothetical protein
MAATKISFMRNLLAGSNFDMVDTVGMRKLPNGLVAKCSIVTQGHSGHYTALRVDIINAATSQVDTQFFKFDNYLIKAEGSRRDYNEFVVIEHCGWEWYILTPTQYSIKEMLKSIETYVRYFAA